MQRFGQGAKFVCEDFVYFLFVFEHTLDKENLP
jgi:hypothetical protein